MIRYGLVFLLIVTSVVHTHAAQRSCPFSSAKQCHTFEDYIAMNQSNCPIFLSARCLSTFCQQNCLSAPIPIQEVDSYLQCRPCQYSIHLSKADRDTAREWYAQEPQHLTKRQKRILKKQKNLKQKHDTLLTAKLEKSYMKLKKERSYTLQKTRPWCNEHCSLLEPEKVICNPDFSPKAIKKKKKCLLLCHNYIEQDPTLKNCALEMNAGDPL